MVQNVSNGNVMLNTKASILAAQKQDEVANNSSKKKEDNENVDKVIKDKSNASAGIYKKPDKKLSADELKAISDQRVSSYKDMLSSMLGKQINTFKKSALDEALSGSSLTGTSVDEAKKAIAPGGEWSSQKVAERILDMAKALSGGDASKFDLLKNAAIKGFGAAKKEWGDELPSITKETYSQTMKNFDDWKAELDKKSQEATKPEAE